MVADTMHCMGRNRLLGGMLLVATALLSACSSGGETGPSGGTATSRPSLTSSAQTPRTTPPAQPPISARCARLQGRDGDLSALNKYILEEANSLTMDELDAAITEVSTYCIRYVATYRNVRIARLAADSASASLESESAASEASSAAAAVQSRLDADKRAGQITYSVEGSSGSASSITYSDAGFSIAQETNASLPWTKKLTIPTADFRSLSLIAQNGGAGDITCTISVGGAVVRTITSSGAYAIASCSYVG